MEMFRRVVRRIVAARYNVYARLALVSAIVLIALMLLTVADVTGRYVFNQPIRGTIEISMQMMAFVIFLSLAYTLVKGAHVRIRMVLDRFPHRLRIQAEVVTDITAICLCSVLIWGSWAQFWDSWSLRELMPAAIDIVWWPARLAMPVGFFIMAIQFLAYLFEHLTELARSLND